MKIMITTAALLMASATSALAQTAPADTTPADNAGVRAVDATTMKQTVTFVTPAESDFVVSDLKGEEIHNAQDEEIGTIEDFIVRDGKDLSGIVVSVGGFLGIGETYVVVDPNALVLTAEGDGDDAEWTVMMDATRDQLKAAPTFEYTGKWDR